VDAVAREIGEARPPAETNPTEPGMRRGRILLVDDNPVNRRVAYLMLERVGYTIDQAEDGQIAFEKVRDAGPFDLVLMDVNMPRMDGFEATAKIRALEGDLRNTPIVAMTASALAGDAARCLQAGMDGYVAKPVKPSALLAAVASWIPQTAESSAEPGQDPTNAESSADPGPEGPAVEPALDPTTLEELRSYGGEDGDEMIEELAQTFLEGAAIHLRAMRSALENAVVEELVVAAHTLKGSAGTLGARPLQELSRQLEEFARQDGIPPDDELIDRIEDEIERVRIALLQLTRSRR